MDFCFVLYGVHKPCQDFVHFLYSWFFVFQSVKSVFCNSILKGVTDFSSTLMYDLSGVFFYFLQSH